MEKKQYKKFDDYTDAEIMGMAKALVRHFAFNTKCAETGQKISFAFSPNKNQENAFYYNDVSYEARMGKGQQGSTPSIDVPADIDALDF